MFTTTEQVAEMTGYTVSQENIIMAQSIIESYVGRAEFEVTDANDLNLLGHATAYQAAYIFNDADRVFTTVKAQQIMQYGNMVTYADDGASPFVAPLAVFACKNLSWKRSRSVKTGPIRPNNVRWEGWKTS